MKKTNKLVLFAALLSFSVAALAQTQSTQKPKNYSSGFSSSKPSTKPQSSPAPKPAAAPAPSKKEQSPYSASRSYGGGSYNSGAYAPRAAQQTNVAPRNAPVTLPQADKYRYAAPTAPARPATSGSYYGQTQSVQVKQATPVERVAAAAPPSPQPSTNRTATTQTVAPVTEPARLKGFASGFGSGKPAPAEPVVARSNSALNRDLSAATSSANALRTLDARKAAAAAAAVTAAGTVGYVATRESESETGANTESKAQSQASTKAYPETRNERFANKTTETTRENSYERPQQPTESRRNHQPVIVHKNDDAAEWMSGYSAGRAASRQSNDRVVVVNQPQPQSTPVIMQNPGKAVSAQEKSSGGSGFAIFMFLLAFAALAGGLYYYLNRPSKKAAEAPRRNYTIN